MILKIRNRSEYLTKLTPNGGYLLFGVLFGDGVPECGRLNVEILNTGCRRASCQNSRFPTQSPPFDFLNSSFALTFPVLERWRQNFGLVFRAIGEMPIGTIPVDHDAHKLILPNLQACSLEIAEISNLLGSLEVETNLYRQYHELARTSIALIDDKGNPSVEGRKIVEDFNIAAAVYASVPELRNFRGDEEEAEARMSVRGRQLAEFLRQGGKNPLLCQEPLDFIAQEVRPMRMSGFQWKQQPGHDIRRDAVDLLLRYRGCPVWCEVKMTGDDWTSAAVCQVFYYGATLSNANQRRRTRAVFRGSFENSEPWLGVIVESRPEEGFIADFDQSVAFVQSPLVKSALAEHFQGIFIVMVAKGEKTEWRSVRFHQVSWS